jgi:sec-independent protein translocase protein TatA
MTLLSFIPHGPELIVVGFIALLIFGNRLPSVMRSLGKSVTEFKKGISGIEDEIDKAASEVNKPPTPATPPTTGATAD